ncbi:MAG: hypothetical protein LBC65_02205 [Oscillospiraceae bacterium]|jgi:hypothetical protein|nr:hypothetical protein [Oscillospiraceae bacterium]
MAVHDKKVSIDGSMFKRAGAWFGVFQRGNAYGDASLYLGTCRGMAALAPERNRLIGIIPTYNGKRVPYTVEARPAELTVVTKRGNIRFTFADLSKLMAEGDEGMGLRFEKTMVQHESVHPRKDGAWECLFRMTCAMIFKGLDGSTFDFNDGKTPWKLEGLTSGAIYGQTRPNANGKFTLVMEESQFSGVVRDSYPTFAEAKASMQADWDAFIEGMPSFKQPYEDSREAAEYVLWTFQIGAQGTIRYPFMDFFAGMMGSQWQMCQNAVAMQEHIGLALDLMLHPLDRIGPEGQLPDMYDDVTFESLMIKPPMHGWALKDIMKRHDLLKECPRDKLELLYTGLGRWANWFMTIRDEDGDGLPCVVHSDETGLDDCSLFVDHLVVTTPDICAYLVLLFEAIGDLAKLLAKPEAESADWYSRATELTKRIIDELWDGERFVGLVPDTREKLVSGSIVHYLPAVLGNRLPKEIINKLADDLSDSTRFLTEWGLASEALDSDMHTSAGFGRGCVIPPAMLYICTGLWETERRDTAAMFAERYCNGLINARFAFFLNARNGMGLYNASSWSCCAYAILARMLSE